MPALAQAAADLDAVDVGEHPVEHDQVGLEARDRRERLAAGRRLLDLEALVAERGRDGVDDRALVVDDEDLPAAVRLLPEAAHTAHRADVSCEPPESDVERPVNHLRIVRSGGETVASPLDGLLVGLLERETRRPRARARPEVGRALERLRRVAAQRVSTPTTANDSSTYTVTGVPSAFVMCASYFA